MGSITGKEQWQGRIKDPSNIAAMFEETLRSMRIVRASDMVRRDARDYAEEGPEFLLKFPTCTQAGVWVSVLWLMT